MTNCCNGCGSDDGLDLCSLVCGSVVEHELANIEPKEIYFGGVKLRADGCKKCGFGVESISGLMTAPSKRYLTHENLGGTGVNIYDCRDGSRSVSITGFIPTCDECQSHRWAESIKQSLLDCGCCSKDLVYNGCEASEDDCSTGCCSSSVLVQATGGVAFASSSNNASQVAGSATDGNTATFYQNAFNTFPLTTNDVIWGQNFTSTNCLKKVEIVWRFNNRRSNNFDLEVSEDGINWSVAHTETGVTNGTALQVTTIDLSPAKKFRSYRLVFKAGSSLNGGFNGQLLALAEVRAYTPDGCVVLPSVGTRVARAVLMNPDSMFGNQTRDSEGFLNYNFQFLIPDGRFFDARYSSQGGTFTNISTEYTLGYTGTHKSGAIVCLKKTSGGTNYGHFKLLRGGVEFMRTANTCLVINDSITINAECGNVEKNGEHLGYLGELPTLDCAGTIVQVQWVEQQLEVCIEPISAYTGYSDCFSRYPLQSCSQCAGNSISEYDFQELNTAYFHVDVRATNIECGEVASMVFNAGDGTAPFSVPSNGRFSHFYNAPLNPPTTAIPIYPVNQIVNYSPTLTITLTTGQAYVLNYQIQHVRNSANCYPPLYHHQLRVIGFPATLSPTQIGCKNYNASNNQNVTFSECVFWRNAYK